jgi:hypothetical protein
VKQIAELALESQVFFLFQEIRNLVNSRNHEVKKFGGSEEILFDRGFWSSVRGLWCSEIFVSEDSGVKE